MAKYQVVNEKGLQEIRGILADRHKLGGDHFSDSEIAAWAQDVELSLTEGNGACFEIRAADTISGRTEDFSLSPESVEWVGEDDE